MPVERRLLPMRSPFDLAGTVSFLHGPEDPFVRRDGSRLRAIFRTAGGPALARLEVVPRRNGEILSIEVEARAATARDEALGLAARFAGLMPGQESRGELEPSGDSHHLFLRLAEGDESMRAVLSSCRGLRLPQRPDAVATLSSAIAAQLVTTAFAARVSRAFWERFGEPVTIGGERWLLPPSAERVAGLEPEDLRVLQFTRRKGEYVIALCRELAEGSLVLSSLQALPAAEAFALLTARRGIGATTAAWILMFGAGHPDAWPPADVGLQRALQSLQGKLQRPEPSETEAWALRYAGLRSHCAVHLWEAQRRGALAKPPATARGRDW